MTGTCMEKVGWCSWLTGSFMNRMIGKKITPDTLEDFVCMDNGLDVEDNFNSFQKCWQEELKLVSNANEKKRRKPSLARALWRTFKHEIIVAGALKMGWGFFILLAISFFVREILMAIAWRANQKGIYLGSRFDILSAYECSWLLCCFFWLSCICLSVCLQQMTVLSAKIGLRMKSAVSTSVYRKAFTYDRHQSHIDVVSLVASDCTKLGEACTTLQYLWSGILEAAAIMGVLIGFVKTAALPGCAVMVLLLPFQYVTGIAISRMRKRVVDASDARVNLMDEILSAIKLVKMYAWERKFAESVEHLRAEEVRLARVGGWLKSLNLMVVFLLPPLIALSIFAVYEIDHDLTNALAFTTLSLFNTLRLPLIQLPKSLRSLAEARAACERVQIFLLSADQEEKPRAADTEIIFCNASFTYGSNQVALLQDITVRAPKGTLLMLAGPVGSGKTNFLNAIMGQMTQLSGTASVGGDFAYVPQSPWCCHGSVRDNILFGKAYNETFYKAVLFACALETDLKLMKDGDLTQIGERGMNLSGGQKQRIALARAAYSGADTYLLDAPLSAVDMYTCTHIFKHCIMGIMMKRGATVVLVTHQVELFVHTDMLVLMNKGLTQYVGPYDHDVVRKFYPNANVVEVTADHLMNGRGRACSEEVSPRSRAFSEEFSGKLTRQVSSSSELARRSTKDNLLAEELSSQGTLLHDALNPLGPVQMRAKTLRAGMLQIGETAVSVKLDKREFGNAMSEKFSESETRRLVLPTMIKDGSSTSNASGGVVALVLEMKWYLVLLSVSIFIATQVCRIYSDIWIQGWVVRQYGYNTGNWYVGIYGGYVAVFMILLFLRGSFFFWMGVNAASRLHSKMFRSILKAPMSFFTATPLGNVLATFSKDMDCIDEMLLDEIHNLGFDTMILGTTIAVVIKVLPVFAVVVVVLSFSFAYYFYWYVVSSTVLKEVAGVSSSSVIASVSETLQGLDVIRAFRVEERFRKRNRALMETASTVNYNLALLQLWLSVRLDCIASLLVLGTCLLAVGLTSVPPAAASLAVSNSFQILLFFSMMVKGAADIGCHISSVERVVGLTAVPPEVDLPLSEDTRPSDPWPAFGEVALYDVVMSYSPTTPAVLKGVTVNIQRSEKVGVAGRTGAGKSSLIVAIFRLANVSHGAVHIDGIDISKLTLHELRRRIAIIPQEPVMFCGTLRSNLDPFGEETDEQLYRALECCLLTDVVTNHPDKLNMYVALRGGNFSLGQQQLMCLARAMLNPSRLLLLDEATAALDSDTDAAVQRVLRTNFAERTTITIAHRLDTIIDSDKILVMDAGTVAEFDSPYNLLNIPRSIFAQLCQQTGGQYEVLRAAADQHHACTQVLEAQVSELDQMQEEETITL